jgi:hypothetical protein
VAATVTPDGVTFGLWDGTVVEVVAVVLEVVAAPWWVRARAARAVAAAWCFWALVFVGGVVVATGAELTVELVEELTDVVVVLGAARVAEEVGPPVAAAPSVVLTGEGTPCKESVTAAATATAMTTMDASAVREVPSGNGPSPTNHCNHCFRCKPSDLLFNRSLFNRSAPSSTPPTISTKAERPFVRLPRAWCPSETERR